MRVAAQIVSISCRYRRGERMNERRILFVRGQVPRAARVFGVVAEKAKLGRLGEKGEELGDAGGSSGWEGVGGGGAHGWEHGGRTTYRS